MIFGRPGRSVTIPTAMNEQQGSFPAPAPHEALPNSELLDPKAPESERNVGYSISAALYGLDRWGSEFLRLSNRGTLVFHAPGIPAIDLQTVAASLSARGISAPFVLRFPTMIAKQMGRLSQAFVDAGKDNQFRGGHVGVYPLKVNQRRAVVESVVQARHQSNYGLEAGSKPELLLAMAMPPISGLPLISNGYKDREFMRLAFHAAELGHEVIIVFETVREVQRYLDVAAEEDWTAEPNLGMRAKLYSRGSGRWKNSAGDRSKFGLTTNEILAVLRELETGDKLDRLRLLHFHIGSQVTQIKRIKSAVREGTRIWGFLRRRCPSMTYLDLGGGIGVDYDGSHTSHPSSANYGLQEYANQVVFEVVEVADQMGVDHPILVTESGRVLVANHAVTVADLREVQGEMLPLPQPREGEHRIITEMRYTLEHICAKNLEEYYHDAVDFREEALGLFSQGYLTLEDRASAEGLFQRVRARCEDLIDSVRRPPPDVRRELQSPVHKFLVNFSIFQSMPDTWSIDQVFPTMPISGHRHPPDLRAQLVDITCDSDGCVQNFAHPEQNMPSLPLHSQRNGDERYYLAMFFTGAYQDSLANVHNLFGRCHEVIVHGPNPDRLLAQSELIELDECVLEIRMGSTVEDVLDDMDFDVTTMAQYLRDRHLASNTTLGQPWAMGILQGYTYLTR